MNERILTAEQFDAYSCWLRQSERSPSTIEKYLRDVRAFAHWLNGRPVTKELVTGWKRISSVRTSRACFGERSTVCTKRPVLLFGGGRTVEPNFLEPSENCSEIRQKN